MRKARDANKRLFAVDEFLTPQQISSYFSRFAAKRKQLSESEYQAAENENVLRDVRDDIMRSLEEELPTYGHPIIYQESPIMSNDKRGTVITANDNAKSNPQQVQCPPFRKTKRALC